MEQPSVFGKKMSPKIQIVVYFMKTNLSRDLTLNDLAAWINVTPSHLCYLFKAQIGASPMQYLKTLRLQKASELLRTTLLSLKEIPFQVGFKDGTHFMRDFKKAYGLTPTQYREKYLDLILTRDYLARRNRNIG